MHLRDIQNRVAEILTSAIEKLPPGSTKEMLREVVEAALKDSPEVSLYVSIENDNSEAGFRLKIQAPQVHPTDINLN